MWTSQGLNLGPPDYETGAHSSATPEEKATKLATMRDTYLYKYVDADGNISSAKLANSVGFIAFLADFGGTVDNHAELADARILVMAADDAVAEDGVTTSMIWGQNKTSALGTTQSASVGADLPTFALEGYTVTSTHYNEDSYGLDGTNQTTIPDGTKDNVALYAAYNYDLTSLGISELGYGTKASATAVGAKGHWFLPSASQMQLMGADGDVNNNAGGHTQVTGAMSKLPSGYYWSSSEYSAANAWEYSVRGATSYWYYRNKAAGSFKVRPVFAY